MTESGKQERKKDLLFFGSPLLDITAPCSQETLDRHGLKADDCVREGEGQGALFRSLLDSPESQMTAGGSSQNTARVAKWVLGDRGNVAFAGCVGVDEFASVMRRRLLSEGVEPLYVPLRGESTGVCACLLGNGGERSMVARLGAAEHFSVRHLRADNRIAEGARRAHCVFVEGYFLSHSPEVVEELASDCSARKALFSLSLSAEYVCRNHADVFLRVLPRVDILFSNEAEARVIAGALALKSDATVEDIVRALSSRNGARIVVVTRGPNPVLLVHGDEEPRSFPVPRGVQVVDSVGCGDALAGAFLAVYALTGDAEEAVKTGIAAAVEIAQVPGCSPTRKELYPGR